MTGKEILGKIHPEIATVALPELAIVAGVIVCGVGIYSGNPALTRGGLGLVGEGVIPSSVVVYGIINPIEPQGGSQQKSQSKL